MPHAITSQATGQPIHLLPVDRCKDMTMPHQESPPSYSGCVCQHERRDVTVLQKVPDGKLQLPKTA